MALLMVSNVKQWAREGERSLSEADLVANGWHSGDWPPVSLCGFDKDRDLSSSSVYGSGYCGNAYSGPPQPLSRQAGTEADIINGSLSSYPTSPTLSI